MTAYLRKRKKSFLLVLIMLTVLLYGCTDNKGCKPVEKVILDCDMGYMNGSSFVKGKLRLFLKNSGSMQKFVGFWISDIGSA